MTKEPRQGLAAEALRLVASCRQAGQDKTIIQDEEHDDWIHLTRVGTKRLRSAWHLMRDVVGVDRAQQARERVVDALRADGWDEEAGAFAPESP